VTKECSLPLPERLRIMAEADERFGVPKENWAPRVRAMREAADEIERLRDRLATAEQHIRLLIPFAQHAEYPEGDPPQVGRAEDFLRCTPEPK
jgi:hypothetical protein